MSLLQDQVSREIVKRYIDGKLAGYQGQIQQAKRGRDRYAEKVGRILQNELLDIRNDLLK